MHSARMVHIRNFCMLHIWVQRRCSFWIGRGIGIRDESSAPFSLELLQTRHQRTNTPSGIARGKRRSIPPVSRPPRAVSTITWSDSTRRLSVPTGLAHNAAPRSHRRDGISILKRRDAQPDASREGTPGFWRRHRHCDDVGPPSPARSVVPPRHADEASSPLRARLICCLFVPSFSSLFSMLFHLISFDLLRFLASCFLERLPGPFALAGQQRAWGPHAAARDSARRVYRPRL